MCLILLLKLGFCQNDKTLVSWVKLEDKSVQGGSAITLHRENL